MPRRQFRALWRRQVRSPCLARREQLTPAVLTSKPAR